MDKNSKATLTNRKRREGNKKLPGYPVYPENQDIYNRFKEEENIDPENTFKTKTINFGNEALNEKDFEQDKSGGDLDIPGLELDDEQENMGNEDEENNYYSLGGDNHTDLEENQE